MAARRKIIENIMLSVMMLIALAAIVSTNLIYLEQEHKAAKDRKLIQKNQQDLHRDVEQLNETITSIAAQEKASKARSVHIQNLLENFEIKLDQIIKTGDVLKNNTK
jgi:peptidoglycan hydrolase CwlO-like protein